MLEIRASIVVSIPACHAGDRSSILRLGVFFNFEFAFLMLGEINKYFFWMIFKIARKMKNKLKKSMNK